mgnify:CR=1 FL=1
MSAAAALARKGRGFGWWDGMVPPITRRTVPMPRTNRLTDLQLILLSHAARRDNGSYTPCPGG